MFKEVGKRPGAGEKAEVMAREGWARKALALLGTITCKGQYSQSGP
jgi:hypothetical protein